MKPIFRSILPALFILSTIVRAQTTAPVIEGFVGPTETRYWDSTRASNGYTLFAAKGKTYLIDMEGYVINQWNLGTNPRLLDNGDLLDATKSDPSGFGGFRELDWSGATVWEYAEKRSNYFPHHDWTRIYNKQLNVATTLYIANKNLTKAEAIAAGANPATVSDTVVQMDAIVEVNNAGTVVWEWWFFDHMVQDFDAAKPNYVGAGKKISDYPGRLNINLTGVPLRKDWLHCNSIDYNDSLDHIVINSVAGELYIIDHGGTFVAGDPAASIAAAASSKGDFLYRFGDPARYGQGNPPSVGANWTTSTTGHKQIGGSHDVHWIKPGLPGAGRIQIFNNAEYLFERTSQSYIFEIDPYLNSSKVHTASYVNPPTAGYYTWVYPNNDAMKQNKFISNQVVWIYNSKNDQSFFSTIGGSEQRLPNGNTLICSDTQGNLFEVTYADTTGIPRVVWEYINPVTEDGIKRIITDMYPMYNSVFRAYRYYPSHPALAGKTLTRKSTISGKTPLYYKPSDLLGVDAEQHSGVPAESWLGQNYPNPFNPATVIPYRIAKSGHVRIGIYDLLGRCVARPVDGMMSPGSYSVSVNGSGLASGSYIVRLESAGTNLTRRIMLLK